MKYVKYNNTWKSTIQYARSNGSWKRVKDVSTKVGIHAIPLGGPVTEPDGTTGRPITYSFWKSTIPPIGTFVEGGYVAGIMDTLASGGERYLLLVAPKQYQVAMQWSKDYNKYTGSTATSKWNGLENTTKLLNSNYPAAYYCATLIANGYDDWYLPAIDELELLYRNFKPTNLMNDYNESDVYSGQYNGYNPSTDPPGPRYVNNIINYKGRIIDTRITPGNYDYDNAATTLDGYPMQTNIETFKLNQSQSFWPPSYQVGSNVPSYFSSTHYNTEIAFNVFFNSSNCGNPYSKSGRQSLGLNWAVYARKNDTRYVRPVRRILI